MPTGYTADVESGKVTEFRDFALACTRAFGVAITMRDDPSSVPTPIDFEPESYSAEALRKAELERVRLLTTPDAEWQTLTDAFNTAEYLAWEKRCAEDVEKAARYDAMLASAKAWEPPTEEHIKLKEFMVSQLTESREFDILDPKFNKLPKTLSTSEYKQKQLVANADSIAYHQKQAAKDIERAENSTRWMHQLLDSLS